MSNDANVAVVQGAFADFQTGNIPVQGDVLACRFAMSGVHVGTFMGAPAGGRPYELPGITMIRYAGGKAVERWSSADMLGLLVQIGAMPAPSTA